MYPNTYILSYFFKASGLKLGVLFVLFQGSLTIAQTNNLVVNPSFEKRIDFQNSSGKNNWAKCLKNDTPDYISFNDRGEPNFYYRKYIGGLLPYDGESYVGIFCYRIHPLRGIEEVRECIQAPLTGNLEKDTLYDVSLHIALDPESNTAINNINACFAHEPIAFKREKEIYALNPRVKFKRTYYDSITWIELEAQYKARGSESQIVIGNFSSDKGTGKRRVFFDSKMEKKWNMHELERVAYYYVDMVSVRKASRVLPPEEADVKISEIEPVPVVHEKPDTSIIEIAKVKHDSSVVLKHIFFEFDESFLLPESYTELDRLFKQLQQFGDLSIVIEGHTDNMGTYEYNINLSLDRANAVMDYLLKKGLTPERISHKGYGYTRPLSDNRTDRGRQLNRRVAFRITDSTKTNNK